MPVGTAEKHLRKSIIHELAKQLGKNHCCRCGQLIEEPDDLAIVHVQDWDEDPDLFWALNNIAFSHASCEAARSGKRQREKKQMSKVEVRVEDSRGKSLPGTKHEGQLYVAGKKGTQYQVRVRNKTNKNVLVVVTVDGRNVITGKPGDHHDSGHVIGPKSTWTFKGWRTSDEEVAAFEFGKKSDSYSSEMGTPENVGVIGVAVFEELEPDPVIKTVKETVFVPFPYTPYIPPPPRNPWPYQGPVWTIICNNAQLSSGGGGSFSSNDSSGVSVLNAVNPVTASATLSVEPDSSPAFGTTRAPQLNQQLGTGWGDAVVSKVYKTEFKRATDDPCEVYVIRYDSMASLKKAGIMVRPSEKKQEAPQAFPQNSGYCPPPRRRKRVYK